MKHVSISVYGTIKLNSFRPLCGTILGIEAILKYKFPPFIDASCRREPDFQNPFPSISALCRQGQFAPHLRKDDIVVYMTVGGKFNPHKKGHHLVAILQVEEVYKTHKLGEIAYLKDGLQTPNNCMVKGNLPYDFDKTAGDYKNKGQFEKYLSRTEQQQKQIGQTRIKAWNNNYLEKSKTWKCFVKTKPIYINIDNPTQISENDFKCIFGKLPNTRTPRKLTENQFVELAKLVKYNIELGNKKKRILKPS